MKYILPETLLLQLINLVLKMNIKNIFYRKKIIENNTYEAKTQKKDLHKYIKDIIGNNDSPVIFDVGSCVGDTVLEFLNNYPSASIYAFEPDPDSFSKLFERVKVMNKVYCNNIAIGEKTESKMFFQNKNFATNSFLEPDKQGGDFTDNIDDLQLRHSCILPTTSLDNFCINNGIETIDLIKIDTQGYEFHVLKGAKKLIKSKKIKALYFESNFVPIYKDQSSLFDCGAFLSAYGYRFYGIFEEKVDKDNRPLWGEALFVSY
jgi:FkbM family methyltransferase